jgi:hypothetical protein
MVTGSWSHDEPEADVKITKKQRACWKVAGIAGQPRIPVAVNPVGFVAAFSFRSGPACARSAFLCRVTSKGACVSIYEDT